MGSFNVRRISNIIHADPIEKKINQDGLGRYIFDSIKKHGDKIFQINALTGEVETYQNFNQKCIRTALTMRSYGIGEKDIVLLISPNTMEATIPVVATLYLNAIIASLDPSIPLRDVAHLIKIMQPKIIFVVQESLEIARTASREISAKPIMVIMNPKNLGRQELNLANLLMPNGEETTFVPNKIEDVKETTVILFSSGTTGLPKSIKCSHFGLLYTAIGELSCGYDCSVIMVYNSFHWISTYLLTIYCFISGSKKIVPDSFKAKTALEYCKTYEVTTTLLPTSYMLEFTKENIGIHDSPYPKYLIYGGSGMASQNIKKIYSYFPNSRTAFVYGMTEVCGFITGHPDNYYDLIKVKPGSVGVPNPGMSVKIADLETEETLPPNKLGEIRLFTKAFFNGYINEDHSSMYDKDGFLKTGDIGYYDEDNCLYMTDRIKETFKYKGWPIIPNSIENIIQKHPAVQEAIIVGIPHETDGHYPMAVVVLSEKSKAISESDIQQFADNHLSEREKLRAGVGIVKSLPRTHSGKIMRKYIRDLIIMGKLNELK